MSQSQTLTRRQTPKAPARVEIRKEGDEPKFITGYSAVFYDERDDATEYWLWSDYVERLMPGCFDRAVKEAHDARGLYNHNPENLLGRVSNGTCTLSVDKIGLRFEIPIDMADPDHQRVVSKITRGDLSGCSFAFSNVSADWSEVAKDDVTIHIRNITDLDLHDVGPVTFPAYEATEVGLRTAVSSQQELVEARSALASHRDERINRRLADQIELDFTIAQQQPGI